MSPARDICLIGIPEQKIERARLLAQHVIVDHIAPDQIDRPKPVESLSHHLARHDAAILLDDLVDTVQRLRVGEHHEVTGIREIGLGGKEGRGGDTVIACLCHMGERSGQQRAADTIADRIGLVGASLGEDFVEGGEDALLDIIVPGKVPGDLVGRAPGDDEDRKSLIHEPADQRVLLAKIHDVIFIDPWREDEQRPLMDLFRGRFELKELDELVAENHLAGRRGDILADLERRLVGLADGQSATAPCNIGSGVTQTVYQALAARFQHGAQRSRIGRKEIRRRQRVNGLAGIELGLALVRGTKIGGRLQERHHPGGIKLIGLAHELKRRI